MAEALGVAKDVPTGPTADTAGGGPAGAYGGASTMIGRGGPALPSAR